MGELDSAKLQIVKYRDINLSYKTDTPVDALVTEALINFFVNRETSIAFAFKVCTLFLTKDGVLANKNAVKAGALCGIATLQKERYREAASILLKISPDYTSALSEIADPHDLALYITLSALASFSRSELHFLASSDQVFASFAEGAPQNYTELIEFLLNSKYSEFINALNEYKADYQTDPYIFPILEHLLSLLKKRALLQYLSVYRNVSIKSTAKLFHLTPGQLEELLKVYTVEGTVNILIDQRYGVSKCGIHKLVFYAQISNYGNYCLFISPYILYGDFHLLICLLMIFILLHRCFYAEMLMKTMKSLLTQPKLLIII